jgi:hypothetical protein
MNKRLAHNLLCNNFLQSAVDGGIVICDVRFDSWQIRPEWDGESLISTSL